MRTKILYVVDLRDYSEELTVSGLCLMSFYFCVQASTTRLMCWLLVSCIDHRYVETWKPVPTRHRVQLSRKVIPVPKLPKNVQRWQFWVLINASLTLDFRYIISFFLLTLVMYLKKIWDKIQASELITLNFWPIIYFHA